MLPSFCALMMASGRSDCAPPVGYGDDRRRAARRDGRGGTTGEQVSAFDGAARAGRPGSAGAHGVQLDRHPEHLHEEEQPRPGSGALPSPGAKDERAHGTAKRRERSEAGWAARRRSTP